MFALTEETIHLLLTKRIDQSLKVLENRRSYEKVGLGQEFALLYVRNN